MKQFLIKFMLCFVMGGLSALAMAPFNIWLILFLTLGVFYSAVSNEKSTKAAFGYGWAFGFGYFLFGLSWIGNALLVEGNPYAWAWPLAVSGLPFALAFFYALASMVAHRFSNLKTISGYVIFAGIFTLGEWLRGHIFTGFPWNLFGYSWVDILPIAQISALGDVYFLTWLTILWCSIFGFLSVQNGSLFKKSILPMVLIASFCGSFFFGMQRIDSYSGEYHEQVDIKIVQPNIAQHEKWDQSKMAENFFKQLRLSYPVQQSDRTTYIVWPETALSYIYANDPVSMSLIKQMLQSYDSGAYLMTGMLRKDEDGNYANSIVNINSAGEITNIYDKHHLVPFGEYIPFQKYIPLRPVVEFSGFQRGTGLQHLETPESLSYSPLVCYEGIFPGRAINGAEERPDFILNATNDGWYGKSAGPHQHFTQTKFRAIEEGVPFIRAANTGISALIAPTGKTLYQSTLFEDADQILRLPKKLFSYVHNAKIRSTVFFLMVFISMGFSVVASYQIKTKD